MRVGVAPEETAVLVGWRRRSGSRVLAGMKAEAVLHASRGVDAGVIAETVERTERTVQERLADWLSGGAPGCAGSRPGTPGTRETAPAAVPSLTVPAGHAGNQDAAEPARTQKEDLKAILARPPSRTGVHAGFRGAPALRDVVKILFDGRYGRHGTKSFLVSRGGRCSKS